MFPTAKQQDATSTRGRPTSTRRLLLFSTALLAIGFGSICISKEDSTVFARSSSYSFIEPLLRGPELAVVEVALAHDRDFQISLSAAAPPGAVRQVDNFYEGGYVHHETRY